MRERFCFYGPVSFPSFAFAQMGYDLKVAVDTTKMRIGEQIEYILQVKADSTSQITFSEQPFFAPFEVLDESAH